MICLHILPYARNALPRRVGLAVRCETWDQNLGQDQCSNLPVRRHVVPLKARHTGLLLSTQEQMGTCTCEGRFINRGAKLRVRGCILPGS